MTADYFHNQTQIPRITSIHEGQDVTSEGGLIVERLETLTNQTGQLRSEVRDRPVKHNIQIRDLGEKGYSLIEPILITIEEYASEENVIACFPEVEVFGEGATEIEAIINLKLAILDLYDELDEIPEENLGYVPLSWSRILNNLIRKA